MLRGIAALAVVIYHAGLRLGLPFEIGQAGVDIFFVISSFIMWTVAGRGVSPLRFVRDRIARIVPLYWIATLALALGAWVNLFPRIRITAVHVLESLLFIPHFSPSSPNEVLPLLPQGCPLNYEMCFYSLFAHILFLPRIFRAQILIGLLGLLAAVGFGVSPNVLLLKCYTAPLIMEFGAGVLIG